jgi:hypothetical protein
MKRFALIEKKMLKIGVVKDSDEFADRILAVNAY